MGRDLGAARRTAIGLAVAAGKLQPERRSTVVVGARKAHANDLVSDVDLASERLIVDGVSAAWPGDGILAEEGSSTPGTTGWRWLIDPLDGTRNYLSGAGPWSVCIALQEGESTRVAVVHDPVTGETFNAIIGNGARLGDAPLRASGSTRVDEAIVGLSFNPRRRPSGAWGRCWPAYCPPSVTSAACPRGWPWPTPRPGASTRPCWSTPGSGTSQPAC
jgi:myo-inositol-1(or 4)-monophosphatase